MQNNLLKNSKIQLVDEILNLRETLEKSKEKIKVLEWENQDLKWEVQDLQWKLNINSTNSSKPSSTETLQKKTQICNSREKGKNPRWWVIWHKGANHKQYENPDIIESIPIHTCSWCGHNLEEVETVNETKRQVVDIPKPIYIVTEFRWWEKTCPCCQKLNKANFPVWVEQEIQFWANVIASSVYLYNYQITSFERLQEYWKEVYWLDISQTTLMSFNKRSYSILEGFENQLINALIRSNILNGDETWVRINWKTNWVHNYSTHLLTYYSAQEKRGKEAMDEMKILEYFKWILVSDHWKSYKSFIHFLLHAFCNAHHLRELKWVIENEMKIWAEEMKQLLLKAKKLKEEAVERKQDFLEKEVLNEIHNEFKTILQKWKTEYQEVKRISPKRWRLKKDKWLNLLERLEQSEDWTLWFIDNFLIPFDNNLAERDLRMVKTRTKISGCFRSFEGARNFCRIRSYISTMRKQGFDIYKALYSIFSWEILLPNF